MSLISVIVPVYNAAPFLSKCVESILAQQVEELELILIDDGSKDNSLAICEEYAAQDSRIKVISKPNGGASSARNCGLDNATGEWVTFVDADDWLSNDAFVTCLPYMEEYEIIRFATLDILANGRTHHRRLRYASNKDEAFRQVVGHDTVKGISGNLYRRRIFEENGIRFDTSLVYGEDWWALAQAMYHSKSVKTISNLYGYMYNRTNETSCSNTISGDKLIQSLVVVKRLGELVGKGYERELKRSRCYRTGVLVRDLNCEECYKYLVANLDRVELITLGDILTAKLHLSMRWRLLRFWVWCKRRGVLY